MGWTEITQELFEEIKEAYKDDIEVYGNIYKFKTSTENLMFKSDFGERKCYVWDMPNLKIDDL